MRKSYIDVIRKMARNPVSEVAAAHRFRGQVWLGYCQLLARCPWKEFVKTYVYRQRARSGIAEKWRSGQVLPTRQSAQRVERLLPGTLNVFDSPLFVLLEDRPFTTRELDKIFAPYRAPKTSKYPVAWEFPNDSELRERGHWVLTMVARDTDSFVRRGDLWGFIAALWVVRYSEARGDQDFHIEACKDMYRAMPAALKEPWLAPYSDELFNLLEIVRRRSLYSLAMFDVDMDIIKRQAADPTHEPLRELRPVDPETHRFISIEDPVLKACLIPGKEFRDKQRRNEARRAHRRSQTKVQGSDK